MQKSKVYFTNLRTKAFGKSLLDKLTDLMRAAGMSTIDFNEKYTAIKIHFGEYGNLAFLRPNFARAVADEVKHLGGRPFLTDCNTLYVGSRKNALDHIETAYQNGFNPYNTGCHIIIADGLKGTDDVAVPVPNGELVKNARIGRAIMDADIVISLAHFKGHEMTGFGGAIKNLGMGCGSRAGKMDQHCDAKPQVNPSKCIGCGSCAKACAHGGPTRVGKKMHIDHDKCVGCGQCIGACPKDAIEPNFASEPGSLDKKMAEYALAVIHGRPNFHINIVMDVSPNCDCHGENDAAIVPNVGMFASFDPVALDQACVDAVNAQPVIPNSSLGCKKHDGHDNLSDSQPATNWRAQLDHAQKIGIGTREYELIEVK
ncbi:MAG: DUF362 domain-containing protein [Victivallales bacterium]|nr:DUF362 domain-containing protein [Victivallales bacterium]